MKRLLLIFLFSFVHYGVFADNLTDMLQHIEQNNTTLRALRDGVEVQKLENHTGLTLDDPEVEYSHYWSSPASMGPRNDFSVSQSFDFSTLFGIKRKTARSKDRLADINYEERRLEIWIEACQVFVNVVYYNKCLAQHQRQKDEMQRAVSLSQQAFEAGRINKIDCNKTRLALAEIASNIAEEEMNREELLMRLSFLNGGQAVVLNDTVYPSALSVSRGVKALTEEREGAEQRVAESELKMARSASAPQLKVGYVSELTREEKFRGVTVGMSVPLWSNKNNVKRAKAQLVAQKSEQDDALFRLQNEYDALKQRAERLRQYAQTLLGNVPVLSSATVLHNAFQRGDISALDYYIELTADYELLHKALQAERDYQMALAQLAWF